MIPFYRWGKRGLERKQSSQGDTAGMQQGQGWTRALLPHPQRPVNGLCWAHRGSEETGSVLRSPEASAHVFSLGQALRFL